MKKLETNLMSPLDILINNQNFHNNKFVCSTRVSDEIKFRWYHDSLGIVETVYNNCIGFKLVSVQPMRGPCDVVKFFKFEYDEGKLTEWGTPVVILVPQEEEIPAKTRMLKTIWTSLRDTARELSVEISREIIADLRKNVGTKATYKWGKYDTDQHLHMKVCGIFDIIHRKTLMQPKHKWIVTNPEIAASLFGIIGGSSIGVGGSIYSAGNMCQAYNVYVDQSFPKNQILLGQTTDGDCYSYNPYMIISWVEGDRLMSRYSKRLSCEGSKNYAVINLEGYRC